MCLFTSYVADAGIYSPASGGNKSSFWHFFLTSYVPAGIYSLASGGKNQVLGTVFKILVF